jgi:large conductance mechanosensitive channel
MKETRAMLTEFKQFILRGNVIDLAVAVVIGAAFGAIVTSLVENIITPLIGALGGQPDFSGMSVTINGSQILYGAFLNSVIAFLIIAAVIFFAVVKPMNALMSRMRTEPTPDPLTGKCPFCLSEVQIGATRCPFCTQEIATVAA